MTLSELLASYDLDEADVVDGVQERLAALPRSGAAELTAAEEGFWQAHAGLALHDDADPTPAREGALVLEDLLVQAADSLTIAQVAERLGIDRTRVSHRLRHGELYSFPLGRQRRLPRWQLTDDGDALPGLAEVLAALPKGLHPASVAGFFTTAQPDLDGLDAAHWLASGGDVRVVVDEAAGLGHW